MVLSVFSAFCASIASLRSFTETTMAAMIPSETGKAACHHPVARDMTEALDEHRCDCR
jgi:hypothetical protein